MSRPPHRSPQAETHYRLPRETFGMLRIRRFSLTVVCDPCRSRTTVNLVERPELAEVEVGSVDFACPRCSRICRYELQPPHQTRKRLLHEQAIGCRGPADYDPKPFVGPFPLLSGHEELIGDLARADCVCEIRRFVGPILEAMSEPDIALRHWPAGGPWQQAKAALLVRPPAEPPRLGRPRPAS